MSSEPLSIEQPREKSVYEILGRHSVHPFPARMAPGLALDLIAECRSPLRILDPMSGSGTVLAVAQSKGHHAVGVDLDPLADTHIARLDDRYRRRPKFEDTASSALENARRIFASLPYARMRIPENADSEDPPDSQDIGLTTHARRQLSSHWLWSIDRYSRQRDPRRAVVRLLASHYQQAIRRVAGNGPVA